MHRQRRASDPRSDLPWAVASRLNSTIHFKFFLAHSKYTHHCTPRVAIPIFSFLLVTVVILFARTPSQYLRHTSAPALAVATKSEGPGASAFAEGPSGAVRAARPRLLSYDNVNFTLDARPIRLVSGSVHYFRTTPSHWRLILRYARAMGLNAIETYVPWNLHEPRQGAFRFSGVLDLRAFLEEAYAAGLLVLLRPGPYICSEWDLGGLPPYLLADPTMRLRSSHPKFMRAAQRYMREVAEQVAPYIGKAVHGIQIENEYGAYGSDSKYLRAICDAWEVYGFTRDKVMLFTSDNGGPKTILNGSQFDSTHVLKTINLERDVEAKVAMLRELQPHAPAMIAEFWTGWFDHWGENHHVRAGSDVVKHVKQAVGIGASVNLYMFFGGTNYGFMAGANSDRHKVYSADVTSYDYDAFITEYGGARNDKFLPMQTMLRRFWKSLGSTDMVKRTLAEIPKAPHMSAYAGHVVLHESIPLFSVLGLVTDHKRTSRHPMTMEELGGSYGFVLYRHSLVGAGPGVDGHLSLQISGVRDFAYVIADGSVLKTIDRNREYERDSKTLKTIALPADTRQLDIIIENRGRVNYGSEDDLHDRKGILGNITLESRVLEGFECIAMSFSQDHALLRDLDGRQTISNIRDRMKGHSDHPPLQNSASPPAFFRGVMTVNPGSLKAFNGELPGTHCRVFGRGVLWVNGFNVGRFHTGVSGPQRSLFVPGAVLREGANEFMVLHMNMYLAKDPPIIQLFEHPDLGPTTKAGR